MRVLPRRRRKSPDERAGTMSLMDHLRELRHRLLISIYALIVGAVVGIFLYGPAMGLVKKPYCDFLTSHPDKAPFASGGRLLIFLRAVDGVFFALQGGV